MLPIQNTTDERFIGIIPDVYRRKGLAGKENFKVLVTDEHLVLMPEAPQKTKKQVKQNPIKIEIRQVKSVVVIPGRSYLDCCRKRQEEDGSLEIVSADARYAFSLPPARAQKAAEILRKAGLV